MTITLVIHGGAGTIIMTKDKQEEYKQALRQSLSAGFELLQNGATAIDAVEAAVRAMEDCPFFNAGKGSVFTHDFTNELDASIMDGKTKSAGAVCGVTTVRNPISAARKVMEKSGHVLLAGKGADQFAKEQGIEIVTPDYYHTEHRYDQVKRLIELEQLTATEQVRLDHSVIDASEATTPTKDDPRDKVGTVGAVALDRYGNLAAATSTGGMSNKRYNRVGDSPLIGCGTYANEQVAISCTGYGEVIIKHVTAHEIASLMKYKKVGLEEAASEVVRSMPPDTCGVVCVDAFGNIAMPFNSEGMYRGYMRDDGTSEVHIYRE